MPNTVPAAAPGLPSPQPTFLDPATFPDIYGMGVVGSCMAPDYPDGRNIKISKTEPYVHGDVVAVWFRPELIKPGAAPALIKRIAMMPPPWVKSFPYKDHPKSDVLALVMLAQNDRPDQLLKVHCRDVIAIHKVIGLLAARESYKAPPKRFMRKVTS